MVAILHGLNTLSTFILGKRKPRTRRGFSHSIRVRSNSFSPISSPYFSSSSVYSSCGRKYHLSSTNTRAYITCHSSHSQRGILSTPSTMSNALSMKLALMWVSSISYASFMSTPSLPFEWS
ncbi:MAG: hypothetical protein [Caudoviricetes sp.]|nr:MAG: hypothetical protein [Caudoviricetes sp.]